MRVIKRKKLAEFYEKPEHRDAENPLETWYYEAKHANWGSPADVKAKYKTASILKNNRVVFNIAGNKYRLVVIIDYIHQTIYVRFVGTHKEYDKIDAEAV